jgi:hypothetical protein
VEGGELALDEIEQAGEAHVIGAPERDRIGHALR